jgi:hypothetical protein
MRSLEMVEALKERDPARSIVSPLSGLATTLARKTPGLRNDRGVEHAQVIVMIQLKTLHLMRDRLHLCGLYA